MNVQYASSNSPMPHMESFEPDAIAYIRWCLIKQIFSYGKAALVRASPFTAARFCRVLREFQVPNVTWHFLLFHCFYTCASAHHLEEPRCESAPNRIPKSITCSDVDSTMSQFTTHGINLVKGQTTVQLSVNSVLKISRLMTFKRNVCRGACGNRLAANSVFKSVCDAI